MSDDHMLTQARALADQQFAHVMATLEERVNAARDLLATHDSTEAWALIGNDIIAQTGVMTRTQKFVMEMLSAAIVTLAQGDTK
ncbi:hypothetical protein [Nocardia paucivorans]|uniref:hypothetical protein n=1 Tax=Nocardia paucivorans TaxID=114259 RepID=UPI000593949F|nr:hypothetical protein [Nocardia paucivorans]